MKLASWGEVFNEIRDDEINSGLLSENQVTPYMLRWHMPQSRGIELCCDWSNWPQATFTAQAIFDVNTIFDASYRARAQNPELDELIEKGHSNPEDLSERERSQFRAWLRADMNVAEATWFYQDRGTIRRIIYQEIARNK